MTSKEYADYRAVSVQIINRHIKTGKIPNSATKPRKQGSKLKLINSRLADKALDDSKISNRNPGGKRKPENVSKSGGKRNQTNGTKYRDDDTDCLPERINDIGCEHLNSSTTTADANKYKLIYEALLKKQTLEKNEGMLIDAQEAMQTYAKIITACKTKLLSVQSKVAPLIQDALDDPVAAAEIIQTVDDLHREALQDLAGG